MDIATMILKENNAGMSGGGLVIDKAGDVTLSSVSAMDNMAGLNGGGISIHGSGDFTATDVVVNDNEADNDCGGLRVAGFEKVSMAEVSVLGNSASGNGGGLCFKDIGTLALDDSIRVESNTAGEEGGGIHMNGASGSVSVTKTSLEGNSAAIGVAASIYNCMDVALTGKHWLMIIKFVFTKTETNEALPAPFSQASSMYNCNSINSDPMYI